MKVTSNRVLQESHTAKENFPVTRIQSGVERCWKYVCVRSTESAIGVDKNTHPSTAPTTRKK